MRINYSNTNFKNKNILYVLTGDSLYTPHFYGAGGFMRGAEIAHR